jgi:hypothetical protein
MAPTLYSAELSDIAKPVKDRKVKVDHEVEEPIVPVAVAPDTPAPKAKKERSEKQLAAFEKAKETRRLKKETAAKEEAVRLAVLQAEQAEVETKLLALQEKKRLTKEKRRLTREAKKTGNDTSVADSTETPEPVDPVRVEKEDSPEPVPKRQRRARTVKDPSEPPEWFKTFHRNVVSEKEQQVASAKPKQQIRIESDADAQVRWREPLTRTRVTSEVDGHVGRMYDMIFNNRKI